MISVLTNCCVLNYKKCVYLEKQVSKYMLCTNNEHRKTIQLRKIDEHNK